MKALHSITHDGLLVAKIYAAHDYRPTGNTDLVFRVDAFYVECLEPKHFAALKGMCKQNELHRFLFKAKIEEYEVVEGDLQPNASLMRF